MDLKKRFKKNLAVIKVQLSAREKKGYVSFGKKRKKERKPR